jgi:putative NADH-flavin reductase
MKLVVLGATGGTGLELVRQSIERKHQVTAFVRSPEALQPYHERISIKRGNVLDSSQLAEAIHGHDAILSGFGPRVPISKSDANLLRDFAVALTTAMARASLRRVIVISTAFLFKDSIIPPTYLLGRMFFGSVVVDSAASEQIITQTNLDWTVVRPPQLTDKPGTGRYRLREGHLPRFGFKISRADVADSFLNALETPNSIRKILGVSN